MPVAITVAAGHCKNVYVLVSFFSAPCHLRTLQSLIAPSEPHVAQPFVLRTTWDLLCVVVQRYGENDMPSEEVVAERDEAFANKRKLEDLCGEIRKSIDKLKEVRFFKGLLCKYCTLRVHACAYVRARVWRVHFELYHATSSHDKVVAIWLPGFAV